MKQTCLALIAIAATATATATGVSAHSKSERTTPADAATVEAVERIEMRFDAPMRVTVVSLTGPSGEVAVERETGFDPLPAFRARPAGAMPAGAYTVEWRGLSADGHPMQGSFGFTLTD